MTGVSLKGISGAGVSGVRSSVSDGRSGGGDDGGDEDETHVNKVRGDVSSCCRSSSSMSCGSSCSCRRSGGGGGGGGGSGGNGSGRSTTSTVVAGVGGGGRPLVEGTLASPVFVSALGAGDRKKRGSSDGKDAGSSARKEEKKKKEKEEEKKKKEKEEEKKKKEKEEEKKKKKEESKTLLSIGSVIGGVPSLKKLQGASNDDYVDRLNHVWTVFLMALFAIVVSTSQFVGDPIHCWCPAEFTSAYVDYAKSYCWIKNTYYIPMDTPIPVEHGNRSSEELTYYQWVPLILLFQAFMFKFPNILWRLFNGGSGINLDKIVDMAEKTQMGSPEDRDKTIDHISKYMDRWLETHREYHYNALVRAKQTMARVCCFFCNKRAGTYLTAFYLFIKVVYAANVISQFFILNAFLSQDYNLYGFEVLKMLGASDEEWKESSRFPRVTLCDFKIRQLQNVQTWTVQCVLPINLFNEKIFMVVWFWLVLVSTMTCINLISWLYRIIFKRNRAGYIKKYLKINNELHTGFDKKLCQKFADDYLRDDGVFVIRVVSKNSTELVATDLVDKLWKLYKAKRSKRTDEPNPDYPPPPPPGSARNQAAHDKEKEAMLAQN